MLGIDHSQLSPQRKFPNKGRGKVQMIRPGVWDTDTLRNLAEVEQRTIGIDVDEVRNHFGDLDERELAVIIKKLEDEIMEKIKGDSSVQTATQTLELLLQELEVMIKIRRENIVAKLHNPEAIGTTYCPMEQNLKRRTVGDRSFTDLDNAISGKLY